MVSSKHYCISSVVLELCCYTDVGHYRSLLNTYIQKKSLRKPVWNDEPCEGGGYCATVEIEITRGTVVEGRCRKKQLTKREAQEKAAKSLLDQIEGSCAQGLFSMTK